jgi:hypothetical protein
VAPSITEGAVLKKLQGPSNQRFVFGGISPLGNKKTGLMNLTKGILGILF